MRGGVRRRKRLHFIRLVHASHASHIPRDDQPLLAFIHVLCSRLLSERLHFICLFSRANLYERRKAAGAAAAISRGADARC